MYTGSEGLSLQANLVILGLLRFEMLSFIARFNISATGRFQTVLIVPQDTSSETSCPNLQDKIPTVQLTKTSTNQNIVLRDETGTLWSESLPSNQNSQKIPSKYLSSGKNCSLTITNPVNENSSMIIPFSVISAKDLCFDLQKLSGNKDKEIDEYQKEIGESFLYGKYNLYSYAIPKLSTYAKLITYSVPKLSRTF
jgi:hypothetical protein